MNSLDRFLNYVLQFVNWAIYVWGGQGEMITSEAQIRRMETSPWNAFRAIRFWRNKGSKPVPGFDCSGLLVEGLKDIGLFFGDTTANGLLKKCTLISRSDVKRGDWAFRIHKYGPKKGQAYHIGVVVDNSFTIVESMGRDDGVVLCGVDAHKTKDYWNAFGRPSYFAPLIEKAKIPAPVVISTVAVCPYTEPKKTYKNGVKFYGNDARWFEWYLDRAGYDCGCVKNVDQFGTDGAAGVKVWAAINDVQKKKIGFVGDAGRKTRAQIKTL